MKTTYRLSRTLALIESKWSYFFGATFKAFESLAINLLFATFFLATIDTAIAGDTNGFIKALVLCLIGTVALALLSGGISALYEIPIAKTTGKIRELVLSKILHLPMKFHAENHSGNLISNSSNDLKEMERIYSTTFLTILGNVIGAVGATVAILIINWKIGTIVLLLAVAAAFLNVPFVNPLNKISNLFQTKMAELTEVFSDILAGSTVSKIFNLDSELKTKFNKTNKDLEKTALKRVQKASFLSAINELSSLLMFIGIMGVGAYFVINGEGTIGQVIFIIQLCNPIQTLLQGAGNLINQAQTGLAGSDRVFELLNSESEPICYNKLQNSSIVNTGDKDLVVNNLSFEYEPGKPVINNLSFSVPKGQTYAIVGSSGCGKTTLMKLILGLYEPKNGDIWVAGKSLLSSELKEFRKQIGYVPQLPYLFTGTIKRNISYSKPHCTEEEIITAAKQANAHEFINKFTDGYKSEVGEKGTQMSGGQRQRIAIARAILKNAPVLLLDEATSALDNESELLVQEALSKLMESKTSLVVAHRLSTIQNANCILVMDKGAIVESGTHQELLEKNGFYKKLHHMQHL